MTLAEIITRHLSLCDELYQLTVEENRILKHERRPPDAVWREKKQELARRWDESLRQVREQAAAPGARGGPDLERARQRCLQILHLDKENEQLLLRCSLGPGRPDVPPPVPSTSAARRAYGSPPAQR